MAQLQCTNKEIEYLDVYSLKPCPYQTRKFSNNQAFMDLISSIKENGILQPLTATKTDEGYQLISGHRRLAAAKEIGLIQVPVILAEKSNQEIAVLCIIENLHRENLNFFEQAEAIGILIDKLGLTQSMAGEKLSLTQPAIANKLRLLQITPEQREQMILAKLTERHARAVCRTSTDKRQKAIDYIIKHNLNVNKTDMYIDKLLAGSKKTKNKMIINIKDLRLFTNTLTKAVKIMQTAGFSPQFEQVDRPDQIEYKIVIPYLVKSVKVNHQAQQESPVVNI